MDSPRLDKFKLITYQNIDLDERNVVTLLYQPLIGCKAFSLYLVLWALIDRSRLETPLYHHDKLFDLLGITPKDFLDARKKLEAIGLLIVYQNEELFLYDLRAPLSAEEFIKDGNLGAYLYNEIGQTNFEEVIGLFRLSNVEKSGFKNVTTHFDEVFTSLPKPLETNDNFVSRAKSTINIHHDFDFELFFEGLSKNFVDKRKITSKVKEKLVRLSYIYNLDEITMQKVFMDSLNRDKSVELDKLAEHAKKWYQFERKSYSNQKMEESVDVGTLTNEEVITLCETKNPVELLENLFSIKPAASELNIVDRLLESGLLKNELINFLFVFVIGNLGNIPTYGYFEKVAVDWNRSKVETIEDAIALTKERKEKFKQKAMKQKNLLPQDIESDWLDEYIKNIR
ncbi:MAG: DnaD domain protein [Bacilli bacterium]|nr:DnaD domain protein [Bacilli bacterium]